MRILLFILCIAEVLLFTWLQNCAGLIVSPVLFLAVSFAIGFVYLRLSTKAHPAEIPTRENNKWVTIIPVLLFTILSILIFTTLNTSFSLVHVSENDTSQSDVIPTMMHMVKNFVAGEDPYSPIKFVNYTTVPSYLPFQWMPYVIAEHMHFDYRWMAVLSVWLASLYFFIKNFPRNNESGNLLWKLVIPVWPLVVYLTLVKYYTYEFTITVESMVAGYYLLLATALDKQKTLLIALAIPMCLLSRMSIALWVPLCGAAYLFSGRWKQLFTIISVSILFFIIFYWFPFVRKDPSLMFNPYNSYAKVTEAIWTRNALFNGMGFNSWAKQFMHGNIHHMVANYVRLHFILCTLTVGILTLFCIIKRKTYDLHTYLLFSLKIYMAVFYSFIQLPFTYLYIVPVLISSALLSGTFITNRIKRASSHSV